MNRWLFLIFASIVWLGMGADKMVSTSTHAKVVLTIDSKVQSALEACMANYQGTGIVLDPESGDVLAMVSIPCQQPALPSFDLEKWQELSRNPQNSFLSKAVAQAYTPGRFFTYLTALTGLQKKVITSKTTFDCRGTWMLNGQQLNCWDRNGHGEQKLRDALYKNCGVYLYQLGVQVGRDFILDFASQVGFGQKTGLIENEASGNLPTKEWWAQNRPKDEWTVGNSAFLGMGIGANTTPLQNTMFMMAIANGGTLYYPRIIKQIIDQQGKPMESPAARRVHAKLNIECEHLDLMRETLRLIVTDGSGKRASLDYIKVAGTTASFNYYKQRNERVMSAWFCGFAPYEHPKYVFCFMIETDLRGTGGSVAAPIAHRLLEMLFEKPSVVP